MSMRAVTAIGAAVVGVLLACGGLVAGLVGGAANASCMAIPAPSGSVPAGALTPPLGGFPAVGTWDSQAVGNAAIIVGVGARMGVPVRGWIIAVATAIQESSLINLPDLGDANDHDSLGLFQQRPSQGWGTPAQIMDPVYASTKFYEYLLAVPNWQSLPLTQAAQAVQRSAFPDAYAQWEPDATRIVSTLSGISDPATLAAACDPTELVAPPSGFSLPPDTPPAVTTAIMWGFAQLGTPYHLNGDCTAAHSGDPAHQCDCSSLVILSLIFWPGRDLDRCVADDVVDAAVVEVISGRRRSPSSPRCDANASRPPVGFLGRGGRERVPNAEGLR